jgi:hypothetical protein
MATRNSSFGTFDHGAQYFTQRDPRFADILASVPSCKAAWDESIHVFDEHGRVSAPQTLSDETHWISAPRMNALPQQLAQPLVDQGAHPHQLHHSSLLSLNPLTFSSRPGFS